MNDIPIRTKQLKVGLEIHVELQTRSKMFTRTPNVAHPDFEGAEPNTLVDPVVAALPGTLPVMNKSAVEMSMLVGLALGCEISRFSKWDRKNYYYPDLPKGYQISQYDLPLCEGGSFTINSVSGAPRRIGITRAHLEEDTGKLGHELPGGRPFQGSLVDLNRAGTPLLEIVTEPDFDDGRDVVHFAQELRSLCRFLGVTQGVMQRGHMRFEPNINLEMELEDGRLIKTPIVEVKNLNSFRAVLGAIEYEYERQEQAWREDGREMGPGAKATRGWDDEKLVTLLQREKEDAHDYRYFPDPDLVPVVVDDAWLEEVRTRLPELPAARRIRYVEEFGLREKDADVLLDERPVVDFFEAIVDAPDSGGDASAVCKLLLNQVGKIANERGCRTDQLGISVEQIAQVIALRRENEIGAQSIDPLLGLLVESESAARKVAEEAGMIVVLDESQLEDWCQAAIEANEQAADDIRNGKMAAIGRLMGHVMKSSGGSADAKAVQAKLKELLS
ncbi:MAG: glutaminyl-tRNA synthase (glutamine-hydrolyzing) subunit B [Planctomycetes bacterium TMED75]|nr:Asp-tRNA(Asn)/Glu-tRNA(Gln) amidotransferase GatCAB subunit B [Planctomycetaceae bacterium]OUU97069.1 MAG: glutaminyl-tRNA synthase (glutamine-hydrolyzing) subunit B [Planctomycetes bacterium TMED75]